MIAVARSSFARVRRPRLALIEDADDGVESLPRRSNHRSAHDNAQSSIHSRFKRSSLTRTDTPSPTVTSSVTSRPCRRGWSRLTTLGQSPSGRRRRERSVTGENWRRVEQMAAAASTARARAGEMALFARVGRAGEDHGATTFGGVLRRFIQIAAVASRLAVTEDERGERASGDDRRNLFTELVGVIARVCATRSATDSSPV